MPLSVYYCRRLIRVAEKLKLRTVSRYIERQMIEYEDDWDYSMYHVGFRDASFLKAAIKYDLNHFLFLSNVSIAIFQNGICRFENFPECLNNTTEIELGHTETPYIAVNWFLGLERVSDPEGDRIRAYIKNVCEHETARITFQVLIKFLKSNNFGISLDGPWSRGKYTKGITDKVFSTHTMKISEIVNPFEWLDNGALEIEYGIHLEAYHKSDEIWNFNFHEKSFNWANVEFSKVIIKLGTIKGTELYCDKANSIESFQLLKFHSQFMSPKFSEDDSILSNRVLSLNNNFRTQSTETALQIAHGARDRLLEEALNFTNSMDYPTIICCNIVEIAEKLKLRNVSRFIERQMIEFDAEEYHKRFLKLAIRYDLNHYLAHILRMNKPMKDVYEDEDVQLMSRNTIMLIMSKFMKDSF
ncbi:hypothetical protein B9Z55_021523 [Caenorhabditis nigoni]|uniref:Uncharacterized protein n=1 Tax=Caenorhabditis nigoni TaxID=1611254 RepID=A0A2G5TSB0_9PELO|nr:hypothetical protein B9Z55_021523 [Caenorhabditis nigoni]